MKRKSKHYEVNEVDAFGGERRINIVKANSPKAAVKKSQKSHGFGFPEHVRVYPVKLEKKSNSFF